MEAIVSLKRKRSSSSSQNPIVGTFTRSKSQIYHHRHRSGRVRSDSFRRCQFHDDIRSESSRFSSRKKSSTKSVKAEILGSTEMDDMSRILIKDLRSRRVFSPCSEENESGFCVGSKEEKVSDEKMEAVGDRLFSDSNEIGSINIGSLIDREDMDSKCLDTRKVGEKEEDVEFLRTEMNSTDLQVAEQDPGSCVDGDKSVEESVQATPPDAEMLQKLPIASDNRGPKSVFSSRSRVKVFKVPHSFSFRRLLPYLMGMEQDNSSTSTKGNCSSLESRPITIEEVKVGAKPMEDIASDSKPHDKQNFADQTVQQIVDSEILLAEQKDSSNIVSSPASLDDELCEKHAVENSNENIEVPSKTKNLESSILDCSPKLPDTCINGDFNEAKPMDGEASVEKHPLCEDEEVRLGACCTVQIEPAGLNVFDMKCNDKTIDADQLSTFGSSEKINGKQEGGNNDAADKIDDSNGESEDEQIKSVSQSANQVLEGPVNGSIPHYSSRFSDKRVKSCSQRKLGLSPLSQLKLCKSGGSLNYRRLLPFLMDIAKDESRQCHSPELEKCVEENLVSLSPLAIPIVRETPAQILNSKNIHFEMNDDSCFIKMAKQASYHESGHMESDIAIFDNKKAPGSFVMEKEQGLEVINLIPDDKIQNLADRSSPDTMATSSSAVSPYSHADNVVGPLLHSEADCKKSTMVVANVASPVQPYSSSLSKNSYKLEAFGPMEIAVSSRKGILKRSPRGCRGPCSCLNCASFRLNAERAFEFSKNQMQDAEEVALELIQELSHLQNMLGTAASACGDNVVISINQVKEACMRVSEAQELAKNRLMDMNYDLSIHCKTTDGQRPRVKFANNVNQRKISNANPNERPQQR